MTDPQQRVTTRLDGDVWQVTLDHPQTGNALDLAMATQLADALTARPEQSRAVLLLAAGEHFSAGPDVAGYAAADDLAGLLGQVAEQWHRVIHAALHSPVPVLAVVHGTVAGAAVGLLGACDVVVCARSTKLRPGSTALGLSPDGGTTWALTRALGAPRALELLLTDGTLSAADAHHFGLVGRLVDDEDATRAAVELAAGVAAGPVRAMVRTRALVRRAATRLLDEQLDDEARLVAESAADPEGREGVAAARDGRRPDFRAVRS
jgi:2-(1,2-epoxy-1,2-dihydrophenyl)acetyl-CoA isomerase